MPDLERFQDIIRQFGPASALDVLLLSAGIFAALRLVTGTGAMTKLRGAITLVLAATLLGRLFDLTAINYLVANSAGLLLIAGVIVFQPEIRRALDRMGRAGIAALPSERRYAETIDAIVAAFGALSAQRFGALVVIERDTGLQEVIDGGIAIEGRVSSELLENIFFPKSPLHDMAAVLRNNRVEAAGCVLPLSARIASGERPMGTRHRAAIGITEQTDAVSVVASEETGEVSVAVGGQLTAVADERGLRAVLELLLRPVDTDSRGRDQ